ncbi:MAG: sigma-54 dependent transcriptional regulator [Acidobacteriota bacterium]
MSRILIVDDDAAIRQMLVRALAPAGYELDQANDGAEAVRCLESRQYDVVITDLRMSGSDGLDVLRKALASDPAPAVILMSGHGTIDVAVDAIKLGAFDFVQKPFAIEQIRLRLERALEFRRLKYQVAYLNRTQPDIHSFDRIIGSTGSLKPLLAMVRKVARSNSTVLVQGETGTGKELIASAIHHNSDRSGRLLVKVNCAALHENLLESELFGHEKGAFTGADRQRIGRFEHADGGTLFLDEIGDMSPSTQAKILRVLQEREFERLGGVKTVKVDVRILAATHRDLAAMVKAGTFRADLFYRLNVVSIEVPPLRFRKEDIPALVATLLARLSGELKRSIDGIKPDALAMLMQHDWPGNIRELENVIERATLLADGAWLTVEDVAIARP